MDTGSKQTDKYLTDAESETDDKVPYSSNYSLTPTLSQDDITASSHENQASSGYQHFHFQTPLTPQAINLDMQPTLISNELGYIGVPDTTYQQNAGVPATTYQQNAEGIISLENSDQDLFPLEIEDYT